MPRRRRVPGVDAIVRRALAEDRAARDRTTRAVLPGRLVVEATVTAQGAGVLSGTEALRAAARARSLEVAFAARDGSRVRRGTLVARLRGDARAILAIERTVLNFLMHLSGVASATALAVEGTRGSRPRLEVWATRKTTPGLRDLEKAAVVHGGGHPHRRDLSDGVLIKNNHLALVPLATAIRRARARTPSRLPVQVEVRTAREALEAIRAGADSLLLDNTGPGPARAIVRALEAAHVRRGHWVELSGGITPVTVRRYRAVGADAVSLGALTHSAPALPFHLTVRPGRLRRPGD